MGAKEREFGPLDVVTLDELVESIENVTAEDVQRISQTFFDQKHIALTVLGNLNGFKIGREDLVC